MKNFWCYAVLLLFLLSPGFTRGQKISASAGIDTADLLIGQQRKMTLGINFPAGMRLVWPFIPDTLPNGIEIVSKGKIDTLQSAAGRIQLQQILTITSFDTGTLMVPQVYFFNDEARDSAHVIAATDPFLIRVHTVEVDTTKAIRDIKGPLKAPVTFREMLPWIAGVVLLTAVIWFLVYYFFYRKKNRPLFALSSKPDLPAWVTAIDDFEKLRQTKLWQSGRIKEYHTALTEILRTYLEKGYGFSAMEMTSDEIMDALQRFEISPDLRSELREILTVADLVKFAKANPLPDVHDQSMRQAITFVETTRLSGPVLDPIVQTPEKPTEL